MNYLEINESIFESIKHIDEEGYEFWYARELMDALEYTKWENFHKVIKEAMIACGDHNHDILDHFPEVRKMVSIGSDTKRKVIDYKLSRYACYLIVMNGDPRKEVIRLGQRYFATQTRKMEILESEYESMDEIEKRFYHRNLTKKGNYSLNQVAKKAGVKHFDQFHNAGYRGLYNGETADDIAKRKKLRYNEDILDNMGSIELAANLFRITQTEDKLVKDNIKGEKNVFDTHYETGKDIRKFISKRGGTMPEDLPTPLKSLKELEKYKNDNKKIKENKV